TPSWASTEMFHVEAVVPEGTTREQFQLMFQRVLEQRFGLKYHWESKSATVYELSTDGGKTKLKTSQRAEAVDEEPRHLQEPVKLDREGYPIVQGGRSGMSASGGRVRLRAVNEPIAYLIGRLEGQVHAPVEDATGLSEKYDYVLHWSTDSLSTTAPTEPTLM